jgi:hypothetical protein
MVLSIFQIAASNSGKSANNELEGTYKEEDLV